MIRNPLETKWWVLLGLGALVGIALDLYRWFYPTYPPEAVWDYPLFFLVMGALGTVVLTILAKQGLSAVADRGESYYDVMRANTVGRGGDDASLEGAKKPETEVAGEPAASAGGEPVAAPADDGRPGDDEDPGSENGDRPGSADGPAGGGAR